MRQLLIATALCFIALFLYGTGKELEWIRHDYEKVHTLPDAACVEIKMCIKHDQ